MEQINENISFDNAAAFDSGAGTASIHNRRTAALDVLTKALLSPDTPVIVNTNQASSKISIDNKTAETAASTANAAAAAAARSFLDTTSSIYVLDADANSSIISTNPATTSIGITTSPTSVNAVGDGNIPKIFGCWNFLHQAMNEIERFEDEQNHLAANTLRQGSPPSLLPETRLLAEFAVRVARRSDDLDRQKVATCVENFCASSTSNASVTNPRESADGKENTNTDSSSNASNSTKDSQVNQISKGRLDENQKAENQSNDTSNTSDATKAINGRPDINVLLPQVVCANSEIREIVTGRIAAFSFNLGQPSSPNTKATSTAFSDPLVVETFCKFLAANAVSNGTERLLRFLNDWIIPGATADATPASIVPDPSEMEGGKRQRLSPESRRRLLQYRLPPYSLACVLYHVASEAEMIELASTDPDMMSTSASGTISPFGTVDVLQRLSLPVMANVLLGPVLHDALQRKLLKRRIKQQHQHLQQMQNEPTNEEDDMDDLTIAMCLKAILKWCRATGLSLAQSKHIGSKVQINLSRLLGEVLQTDSPMVMSALADLIEDVVEQHVVPKASSSSQQGKPKQKFQLISKSRMTQTRYLMQVPDEASFLANVSEEQLHTIETKELTDILSELSVDVEGQRFRFPTFGRQAVNVNGRPPKRPLPGEVAFDDNMHSMGHTLARIVAALCLGFSKVAKTDTTTATPGDAVASQEPYRIPSPGMLELLSKCASHPSVAIVGIVLPVITPVLRAQVGLATQWLPTLQRRAIIPHHPNSSVFVSSSSNNQAKDPSKENTTLLAASEMCFVEFEEFVDGFRETVLTDALNACFVVHSEYYLASCTAAIEEFCAGDVANEQTSFHLEAALFCLAAVAENVIPVLISKPAAERPTSPTNGTKLDVAAPAYLLRCTAALAKKSKSLNNPLTMIQACRFIRKYAKWFGSNQNPGILDIAADLTLHILIQCSSKFPDTPLSSTIQKETGITPYSEASKTLRHLLCNNANQFLSNKAIAALGSGWEATFDACNRGDKLLTLADRKDTCIGICNVLAALPEEQQQTSLMALALASIACLEAMVKRADSIGSMADTKELSPVLNRAADEIIVLVTTARAFTDALPSTDSESNRDKASFAEPSMMILRRAWPTISIVASKYSFDDSILESLQFLFMECMPMNYQSEESLTFLQNICALAQKVIKNETARKQSNRFFSPVLCFVGGFVEIHGKTLEKIVLSRESVGNEVKSDENPTKEDAKVFQCLDSLALETIEAMKSHNVLGSAWISAERTQKNGQSASETKSEQPAFSTSGLAPLFSFLQTCIMHCPAFLLHVLGSESGGDDDTNSTPSPVVLRKSMALGFSSIIDVEADISVQAIGFLEAIVSLAAKSGEGNDVTTRRVVGEYTLIFQTNMLSVLLQGACGVLQYFVVPDASHLLFNALSNFSHSEEELKKIVLRGLSQEHFFLGKRARSVIYDFCLSLLKNPNTDADAKKSMREKMVNMMTDVWRFHRFENVDAMERSDAVHAFCIRYKS